MYYPLTDALIQEKSKEPIELHLELLTVKASFNIRRRTPDTDPLTTEFVDKTNSR